MTVVLVITRLEAAHLTGLVEQFRDLVQDPEGRSGDPALQRLTPAAYDDAEASREFHALTASDLLDRRLVDAATVIGTLGDAATIPEDPADPTLLESVDVRLDPDDVRAWLRTLAAVRLVLATRLGVVEADDHDAHDPRFGIYDWLGYRLDALVNSIEDD